MTWIYTGEDPGHVRVLGLEDRAPDCTVRIEVRNETTRAIEAVEESLAAVQSLTRPESTPAWLVPLGLLVFGLVVWALICVVLTTLARLAQ